MNHSNSTPKRPVSPARSAAARANGAKSRGPITPQGKYNSSRNATRHGLLSSHLVLPYESDALFKELYDDFHDRLRPQDPVERALVEEMVTSWWRKLRIWGVESAAVAHQVRNPVVPPPVNKAGFADAATCYALAYRHLADNSSDLSLYLRYETRYERQFHRALARLLDLRARSRHDGRHPLSGLDDALEDGHSHSAPASPAQNALNSPPNPLAADLVEELIREKS